MELIPILATIILVATISTFILAIGAYILYKIRERKGEAAVARKPTVVEGELLTPLEQIKYDYETDKTKIAKRIGEAYIREDKPETPKSTVVVQKGKPGPLPKRKIQEEPKQKRELKLNNEDKFFKYTTEGYVPPIEDEAVSKIKWR